MTSSDRFQIRISPQRKDAWKELARSRQLTVTELLILAVDSLPPNTASTPEPPTEPSSYDLDL